MDEYSKLTRWELLVKLEARDESITELESQYDFAVWKLETAEAQLDAVREFSVSQDMAGTTIYAQDKLQRIVSSTKALEQKGRDDGNG